MWPNFIPKRWRSRFTFPKGHVNSPSQKGHVAWITWWMSSSNLTERPVLVINLTQGSFHAVHHFSHLISDSASIQCTKAVFFSGNSYRWWEDKNTHTVDGNQKSGINSPVEGQVVYPIIYRVLAPSQVVQDFWTINSNKSWHGFCSPPSVGKNQLSWYSRCSHHIFSQQLKFEIGSIITPPKSNEWQWKKCNHEWRCISPI